MSKVADAYVKVDALDDFDSFLRRNPRLQWAMRRLRCQYCGQPKWNRETGERVESVRLACHLGRCTVWTCPRCGRHWGSAGPVDCRHTEPGGSFLVDRMKRAHLLYARRRR